MYQDVSPTCASGDYLAPLAKPKPRLLRRPAQDCYWGFNSKEYGGIGVLVFDQSKRPPRKGLLVSRSHNHVGCGIHKFHPVHQPYQVTSLKKSSCRACDQLIPNICKTEQSSIKEPRFAPVRFGVENQQDTIFEQFPRFDSDEKREKRKPTTDVPSKRKMQQLGEHNTTALEQHTKDIYHTNSHKRDFPLTSRTKPTSTSKQPSRTRTRSRRKRTPAKAHNMEPSTDGLSMAERSRRNFEEIASKVKGKLRCTECMCFLSETDICGGENAVNLCSYCRNTGIFRVRQKIDATDKGKASKLPGIRAAEQDAKANEQTQSYVSPLNYLGYYSGRHRRRLSATVRNLPTVAADVTDASEGPMARETRDQTKRMDLTRVAIPVSLRDNEFLKNKSMYCPRILFQSGESAKWKPTLSNVLPMLYFPISDEQSSSGNGGVARSPPSPTPDVVKSFRSRAHKRYQDKYPENIPDLRESQVDARKFHFNGYHTSVMRG